MNTVFESFQQSACDLLDIVLAELFKYDDIVNPVEKFGTEAFFQLAHNCVSDILTAHSSAVILTLEAESRGSLFSDELCADIGGHNDYAVLEINLPALRIGEHTVVKDLKQHIEHIGMSLFNLVKEDYAVRLAAHLFGELTALVIADIARR